MKAELQEKLFQKYPGLFKQKDLSAKESAIGRGVEIEGNGWYWLLDKLCGCIQDYIDCNKLKQIEFVQVKEKLGRLCIYTNYENDIIDGMIWFVGHLSRHICERCGSNKDASKAQIGGRIITLCEACRGKEAYAFKAKQIKGEVAMTEVHMVLRSFSESRKRQPDIEKAVDKVCQDTKLDKEEVLAILDAAGVYVLPGSEMERSIKDFVSSVDWTKITIDELIREVGFRFVISDKESKRLVESVLSKV